jgi:hypothetical protein
VKLHDDSEGGRAGDRPHRPICASSQYILPRSVRSCSVLSKGTKARAAAVPLGASRSRCSADCTQGRRCQAHAMDRSPGASAPARTFQLSCGSMTAKASAKAGTGPGWRLTCSSAVARWRAFADLILIPTLNPTPADLRGPDQRIDVVQTALAPITPHRIAPGAITAITGHSYVTGCCIGGDRPASEPCGSVPRKGDCQPPSPGGNGSRSLVKRWRR